MFKKITKMFTFCPFILLRNRNRTSGMYNKPLFQIRSVWVLRGKEQLQTTTKWKNMQIRPFLRDSTNTPGNLVLALLLGLAAGEQLQAMQKALLLAFISNQAWPNSVHHETTAQTVSWMHLACQALNSVVLLSLRIH